MHVQLLVVEGVRLGTLVPVRGERFLIGRDARCQLRPRSAVVSLFHCVILRTGSRVSVQDLGSTNGTIVNDRCLRQGEMVRVKDGDRLQVAQLSFAFQITSEPADRVDAEEIDEWLNHSARHDAADDSSRTLLLTSPVAAGDTAPAARPPSRADDVFAFRDVDPAAGVTCVGLGPAQLTGETEVQALRQALREVAAEPHGRRLVVDLAALDALPSTLYALLNALAQQCKEAGGGLRLSAPTREIRARIAALKLGELIACYDDRLQAAGVPWDG